MLRGKSVSGGVAVGRAVVLRTDQGGVARLPVSPDRIEEECRRLRDAARAASEKLQSLSREKGKTIGGEVSAILSAHSLIAIDPAFLTPIEKLIRRQQINAEWALLVVAEDFRRRLARASDPVFSQRGEDVLEVARSIAAELGTSRSGKDFDFSSVEPGAILVADELSPVQAARLDPRRFSAIALERGGTHSHAAIIARSFGLPAIVGVTGLLEATARQRPIIVDGDRGVVEPRPTKDQIRRALERAKLRESERERLRGRQAGPVLTRDGVELTLRANLELPEEAEMLARFGARGVGLFRSEFLYLRATDGPPAAPEQREVYEQLLALARPHEVVVRTYDLGGEKDFAPEVYRTTSPLALRGIRYSLAHPEMFREQLRALVQASRAGKLRILLPMISCAAEVVAARAHLEEVAREEGVSPLPPLGVMVEVPSAAVLAASIAAECDFFSIGTNDLAQYALAADRGDPEVAGYYRPASPAVLRMIKWVVDAAAAADKPVAVCGELAGDPLGAAMLVGLGIRELSMAPVLLPGVQEACRGFDSAALALLAGKALECAEAREAEEIFRGYLEASRPKRP